MTTHLTHWGMFEAETDGTSLTSVRPSQTDPEPTSLIDNVASAQHHPTRIDQPHVRSGWLRHGPGGHGRGSDQFVPVSWDYAIDLLSAELHRVYTEHGPTAVFGGSYGWGSAGRFHHAQSQVHRFLNCLGGYVRHVHNYSYGTSSVLLPHIIGDAEQLMGNSTSWRALAKHTELVVAFGGISPKNSAVSAGGVSHHDLRTSLTDMRSRGCRFVSVSPLRDDTPPEVHPEWIAPRPGSDPAMLLALAHVLDAECLADAEFLTRYTTGYRRFASYLRGEQDGVAKTPEWAESITEVPAARLRELAREMARSRTLLTVSWSLQRTHYGEQPLWLGIVVAAMLGQLGLPGGGFGHGYGSTASIGHPRRTFTPPALPQGRNGTDSFIPVARIADMLLQPGEPYHYNGRALRYPDIRLVYWCGGNPFHHHQDLARLREAFSRPDTVVVHDPFWTATARHADIVLPSTMSIERDDFGTGKNDPLLVPMRALTSPHAHARDDYAIFTELSRQLGTAAAFTEGREPLDWLRHLYENWVARLAARGHQLPTFNEFWAGDGIELPADDPDQVLLDEFRADPQKFRLATPSGKIEIFSATIDSFGYSDCPGHPVWLEPDEWLGGQRADTFGLHLVANQPRTKLHSQLDFGAYSQRSKIHGREPARLHPDDAASRGVRDGALARIFNDRGSCLVGVVVNDDVRPGVVQLSTGAWYDPCPENPRHCRHGNPNVLTADRPSSTLSQACSGQHALVEIEPYHWEPPPLAVDRAPR